MLKCTVDTKLSSRSHDLQGPSTKNERYQASIICKTVPIAYELSRFMEREAGERRVCSVYKIRYVSRTKTDRTRIYVTFFPLFSGVQSAHEVQRIE